MKATESQTSQNYNAIYMDMRFRAEHTHVLFGFKILMHSRYYGGPEQPNMFKYEHYKSLILLST